MSKPIPIRVGDKFFVGSDVYRVVATMSGGRIRLVCREKSRIVEALHRSVKTWERASSLEEER